MPDPDGKEPPLQSSGCWNSVLSGSSVWVLRSTKIRNGLPSPVEILHGRSLITGAPVTVDHICRSKTANITKRAPGSRHKELWYSGKGVGELALIIFGLNVTGIDEENRCYQEVFEDTGRSLRCTRTHFRPRGPDILHISEHYLQQQAVLSQNSVLSGQKGENRANQARNSVHSGPTHNLERDTAVDFVSNASEERTVTFSDNPVSETRYIPLRLCDRPPQQRLPPPGIPIDLMTPPANKMARPKTVEQQEDHGNVPDTGSEAGSSTATTSGTSESSPDNSSTMETRETTPDMASTETSGSSSSSDGSTESDSTPSTPPSPRRTSMPCTEEAMTAKVPSWPPSPSLADSFLEVRQILRDQAGCTLTCSEYQKQTNAAKERATVLKRVAQLDINQLPKPKPGPQPGPSGESNGASWCVKSKQRDSTSSSEEEDPPPARRKKPQGPKRH